MNKANEKSHRLTRRAMIKGSLTIGVLAVTGSFSPTLMAADAPPVLEHPFRKPKQYTDKGRCSNCGMILNMWARTRHEFENSEGSHTVCSIRCLADMSQKIGEKPGKVQAALYLEPERMAAADSAVYVLGSMVKGTMTMKSKPAFASSKDAEEFITLYGGKAVSFSAALAAATKELT